VQIKKERRREQTQNFTKQWQRDFTIKDEGKQQHTLK
jgi:hypothetical protein